MCFVSTSPRHSVAPKPNFVLIPIHTLTLIWPKLKLQSKYKSVPTSAAKQEHKHIQYMKIIELKKKI